MKQLIILTSIFFSLTIKSQKLPYMATFGFFDKKAILKELNKDLRKYSKKGFKASVYESLNGDTIVYYNKNNVEGYRVKYILNLPPIEGTVEKFCGFQEFTFDCSPCSNKHLKDVLSSYGFKKISENKYLSEYAWKTELEVLQNPESKECLILIFHYVDKPKKDYKALYKTLPEN
jgi:hypothetical protein